MRILGFRQRLALSFLLLAAFAAASKADDFAYVGYGGGSFGTIDLNTGSVTVLGNLGQTPAGLGVFDGTLYAESYNTTGTLYSVNTSNGALTPIGNSGVDYLGGFGSTLTGLYGVGYASGGSTLDLFSINPSNGSATDLGSTGLTLGSWRDISVNSSTLYFGNGPDLYTLDLTNGSSTLIGPFGGSAQAVVLVTVGSTLYGADDVNDEIDTVNPATGAATAGSASGGNVWGLAQDPLSVSSGSPVPEPSSFLLLGTGVVALLGTARRKIGRAPRRMLNALRRVR